MGSVAPFGVAAASRKPASALPALKPMLRAIWLIESTLAVSAWGTPASTSSGITAETPPTAKPSRAIAARTTSSDALAAANSSAAAMAMAAARAYVQRSVMRAVRRGSALPAMNPSSENGISAAPAATPGSAKP